MNDKTKQIEEGYQPSERGYQPATQTTVITDVPIKDGYQPTTSEGGNPTNTPTPPKEE